MKKRIIVIVVIVFAAFAAWYAFRPERLFVNRKVNEPLTPGTAGAGEQALASGSFHSVLHPTQGTASIYRGGDGAHVLRLTNFMTSNGPDVHIYMVSADVPSDKTSVEHAESIDLGTMKGNIGDQDYTLSSNIDVSKYHSVVIWCKRFSFNFGYAPLVANPEMSQN